MPLSGLKPRSDSARIRNMLSEIEAALEKGASREDVWKTLKEEQGLTVTFDGFCKALQRARARISKQSTGVGTQAASRNVKTQVAALSDSPKEVSSTVRKGKENSESAGDQAPASPINKDRIRTAKDFMPVRNMDFSDLDDKYK